MGKREDARNLLWQGLSPDEIAKKMGVNWKTSLAYLSQMVGEGRLRRSDIYLSVPKHRRLKPANPVDKAVVKQYGGAEQLLGDIYEDVRFIEVELHKLIWKVLQDKFGEVDWWREGIPESVRKDCQNRREEDSEPVKDAYNYTDLINLKTILDKKWNVLRDALPNKMSSDKKKLMGDLQRLNQIRNMVMHPIRGQVPSEEDFDFLREFRKCLEDL